MSLDPYHLTPAASLNRLRIVDLPGLDIPDEVRGKTGYELASTHYLSEQIRLHSAELKLSAEELAVEERELPRLLDRCFKSGDAAVQAVVRGIGQQLGCNLACLLLTLKRGDAVNREARPDWDASYWDHWHSIRLVLFGGGLISGYYLRLAITPGIVIALLRIIGPQAMKELNLRVNIAGNAGSLPLIGAACHLSMEAGCGVVLDFGGSFVKRALIFYEQDDTMHDRSLPSIPVQWTEEGQTENLFRFMADVIADTWRQAYNAGRMPSRLIPVSIAAYIRDGQPLERQGGIYAALRLLSANTEHSLSEAVSKRLGSAVQIRLLHDGTAAASSYAGSEQTAVMMLGTAIGIGFPPPSQEGLRPILRRLR
jgi:hypothetical protein